MHKRKPMDYDRWLAELKQAQAASDDGFMTTAELAQMWSVSRHTADIRLNILDDAGRLEHRKVRRVKRNRTTFMSDGYRLKKK